MAGRLEGKKAIVTAAAQGIGRATAVAMVAEGATVLATDINTGLLSELDGVAGITTGRLDVLDPGAIASLAASHGAPDILCNVAGFVHHGSILAAEEDDPEFNLPLWESGPRRLELDLAGRRSDYSTSGGISSYKTGVNLSIAEFLRFRATSSRDVREPTFSERFDLQGGGGRVNDPVFNNASVEITTVSGGNEFLRPEKADTTTAGFVFESSRLAGFQFSVDWYEIDLKDAVGQLGAQVIVNECSQGVPGRCDLISRDPLTNAIGSVRNVFLNIDSAKVRGLDYELLFNTEPNFARNQSESLTFRFLAGRLLEDSTTSRAAAGGFVTTDNSNRYDEPDFEALASVRYQIGAFGVNWQQRYIPETRLNVQWLEWYPGIVLPTAGTITVDDNTVEGQTITDLTFSYDASARNPEARWGLSFAVSNLFDSDPPVLADFGQRFSSQGIGANAFDVYGRRFLASFDYNF
jgi:outer membrane receptor protein involved in Fe transport